MASVVLIVGEFGKHLPSAQGCLLPAVLPSSDRQHHDSAGRLASPHVWRIQSWMSWSRPKVNT